MPKTHLLLWSWHLRYSVTVFFSYFTSWFLKGNKISIIFSVLTSDINSVLLQFLDILFFATYVYIWTPFLQSSLMEGAAFYGCSLCRFFSPVPWIFNAKFCREWSERFSAFMTLMELCWLQHKIEAHWMNLQVTWL